MRMPNIKQINKLTPSILYCPIIEHLSSFEGDLFDEPINCPFCNSSNCKKHKIEKKLFCKLIGSNGFKDVYIFVQVFYCKDCHKTFLAKSPFYRGILYCKPIVDLCLYFTAKNPYHRVEKILLELGIQIDRDSIRNYAIKFKEKINEYASIKLFEQDAGINFLKVLFEVNNVKELRRKYPHKKYDAVADETYPAIRSEKKKFKEINQQRKLDKKEQSKYPRGFTLATSYLASLKSYSSLVLNNVPFCQVFSKALLKPIRGSDFLTTDGHGAYNPANKITMHLRCLLHKSKNLSKKDPTLRKMKKNKKSLKEIKDYLSKKYENLEEETVKKLRVKLPNYFEKNKFVGALTTNSIEGGNWRIKNELRTCYFCTDSIMARTILICLVDSIFTFRKGKPTESFAHKHTNFSFEKIMSM